MPMLLVLVSYFGYNTEIYGPEVIDEFGLRVHDVGEGFPQAAMGSPKPLGAYGEERSA